MKNIFNSIAKMISDVYTYAPIYYQKVPQHFERPSFFIQYVTGDTDEMNKDWRMETMSFQVVFFSPLTEYDFADIDTQLAEVGKIKGIFNGMIIPIVTTDRKAKITSLRTDFRDGEVYMDIDLYITNYFEIPKEEEQEPMGEIIFPFDELI
jgi:hypothetical protein